MELSVNTYVIKDLQQHKQLMMHVWKMVVNVHLCYM